MSRPLQEWLDWWRDRGERELRCILMTAWDPIGVGDAPEAWSEYDSYAGQIVGRLRRIEDPQAAAESVAEYLTHVERDLMELSAPDERRNRSLADSLVAWHAFSFERGARRRHEWIDED